MTIAEQAPLTPWNIVNTAFRQLWFQGSSEPDEQVTNTRGEVDEQVTSTRGEVDEHIDLNTWLHLAEILEQPNSVEHSIYANFYSVKQVQSVYVQDIPEVYNAFIFLNQEYYDEELMDRLLDRESKILDTYQDALFNFHYLPLLSNSPEQSIPENATLIFSR